MNAETKKVYQVELGKIKEWELVSETEKMFNVKSLVSSLATRIAKEHAKHFRFGDSPPRYVYAVTDYASALSLQLHQLNLMIDRYESKLSELLPLRQRVKEKMTKDSVTYLIAGVIDEVVDEHENLGSGMLSHAIYDQIKYLLK